MCIVEFFRLIKVKIKLFYEIMFLNVEEKGKLDFRRYSGLIKVDKF